jgi:hypothetical protein
VASAGMYGDLISFRFSTEISCERPASVLPVVLFYTKEVEAIDLFETVLVEFMKSRGLLTGQALNGGAQRKLSELIC